MACQQDFVMMKYLPSKCNQIVRVCLCASMSQVLWCELKRRTPSTWCSRTKPAVLTVYNHMVFSTVWNRMGRSITMNWKVNTLTLSVFKALDLTQWAFSRFIISPYFRVPHSKEAAGAEETTKWVRPELHYKSTLASIYKYLLLIIITSLFNCMYSGVVTPPPAALVRPGTVHTYEWMVPVGAGPVQGEADCLTYLYYSGVDPVKDTNSGLVGPLLVCRPGSLKRGAQVRKRASGT